MSYTRNVGIRRLVGIAIVVICIGVPLIESVDTWDHTLSDGNDTEANVVLVALCVGLALSTAVRLVVTSIRSLPSDTRLAPNRASIVTFISPALLMPHATASPPHTPLRI